MDFVFVRPIRNRIDIFKVYRRCQAQCDMLPILTTGRAESRAGHIDRFMLCFYIFSVWYCGDFE